MARKSMKLSLPQPVLMKISNIHIPKKDYPPSGQYPPDSRPFEDLKRSLDKHGLLLPVFVNRDGLLFQGHYRYWAWQQLGKSHIPVIIVEKMEDISKFFEK